MQRARLGVKAGPSKLKPKVSFLGSIKLLSGSPSQIMRLEGAVSMYYSSVGSPVGRIHMLASDQGLSALYFDSQAGAMEQRFPRDSRKPGRGNTWLSRAAASTCCYFAGDLDYAPEIPLDIQGTPTQLAVWKALQAIPPAETRSYQQVANKIGKPRASRAIGAAVGRNPVSLLIPCHRVIGSSGKLTGYAGGLEVKRFLLEHESKCARQEA